MQDAEKVKRQIWSLILLFKYDRLIAHKTLEIQLQMDFAFSFEMWQSLCVRENANGNARFAIAFILSQFMRPHVENAIENTICNSI